MVVKKICSHNHGGNVKVFLSTLSHCLRLQLRLQQPHFPTISRIANTLQPLITHRHSISLRVKTIPYCK